MNIQTPSPRCSRILVVDDNADSAESISLFLKINGHEVRVAHDGPSTLEITSGFDPQIILLDIGLPGMDGYEVARRLRQRPEMKKVLLVAITGYGQAEDRQHAKEAGFDHHLIKPIDPDDLLALVISAIPSKS